MNRRGFIGFLVAAPVTKALPWGKITKLIEVIALKTPEPISIVLTEIIVEIIKARNPELLSNMQTTIKTRNIKFRKKRYTKSKKYFFHLICFNNKSTFIAILNSCSSF